MMRSELRLKMKKHSRVSRGLHNILRDDLELIRMDIEDYNLLSLDDSIKEVRDTLRRLNDCIEALEYVLYLASQRESREKHSHL